MRIGVARHNGLGDIVMLLPFLLNWTKEGHEVTLYSVHQDHGAWVKRFAPEIRVRDLDHDPYTDFRHSHPHQDRFLNLNRLELQDDLAVAMGVTPVNWQYMVATQARLHGLSVPSNWSPSSCVNPPPARDDRVLIFGRSTHPTRTMGPATISRLLEMYPGATLNPHYRDKVEMIEAIGRAGLVVGTDSGAIHVAEMMRTPWVCLHTTFSHNTRHKFYHYGRSTHSNLNCAPCYHHNGCGDCHGQCNDSFDLEKMSDGK